mgnify:CR=1 FL=1
MAAPQALIKDLEGEVNVSRNGETVAVKAGDYLLPGDEVVTGATGRLALEFPGTEGQIPAAGVMTANGKLTLGEQTGANGQQQIVVIEDGVVTDDVAATWMSTATISTTAPIRPTIMRAKYSDGPNSSATSVSGAAKAARISVPTQPAKNEPRPAAASAGPARPLRAIW